MPELAAPWTSPPNTPCPSMTAMQFPAGDSRAPASGPLHLPSPLPRSLYSFLKSSMLPSPSFNFLLRCYHFLVVQWLSREAQYWSFSFSISSSSENSELISFWIDWFDLLQSKRLSRVFSSTFSSVQSLSRVRLFVTPCTAAHQASLSITNSWSPPSPCLLSR